MTRPRLFLRMLLKAAWVRKDRALTALLSVAVVAGIATAALTVYSDLESKLSREFRSFGPNVAISKPQGTFTADDLALIGSSIVTKHQLVPVAYAIVSGPEFLMVGA